jgi:hypothetical protein
MEIVLGLLVIVLAGWWWMSRNKPSKSELDTLVASYKVPEPTKTEVPLGTEATVVVPEAVAPAAVIEQVPAVVVEQVPAAKDDRDLNKDGVVDPVEKAIAKNKAKAPAKPRAPRKTSADAKSAKVSTGSKKV